MFTGISIDTPRTKKGSELIRCVPEAKKKIADSMLKQQFYQT
jgi:hypothetical protein